MDALNLHENEIWICKINGCENRKGLSRLWKYKNSQNKAVLITHFLKYKIVYLKQSRKEQAKGYKINQVQTNNHNQYMQHHVHAQAQ